MPILKVSPNGGLVLAGLGAKVPDPALLTTAPDLSGQLPSGEQYEIVTPPEWGVYPPGPPTVPGSAVAPTVPTNPLTVTPFLVDTWDALTQKMKWDVITSLRGPDCIEHRDGIKHFSTAIIRARLTKVTASLGTRVGGHGHVNATFGLVIVPHGKGGFLWNASHFFEHTEEAAQIIGLPVLRLSTETYLHLVSCPYVGQSPTFESWMKEFASRIGADKVAKVYNPSELALFRQWVAWVEAGQPGGVW